MPGGTPALLTPQTGFLSCAGGHRGPKRRQTNPRPLPRPVKRSGWVQTRFGRAPGELQNHSRRTGQTYDYPFTHVKQ